MALTISAVSSPAVGEHRFHLPPYVGVVAKATMSSSYPTGGESWTPAAFGLKSVDMIMLLTPSVAGYLLESDFANKKVKAMRFDYPAASAGVAVEVPNATNLSSVSFYVLVIGKP